MLLVKLLPFRPGVLLLNAGSLDTQSLGFCDLYPPKLHKVKLLQRTFELSYLVEWGSLLSDVPLRPANSWAVLDSMGLRVDLQFGEVAQQLKVLTALSEDWSSIFIAHVTPVSGE